MESPIRPGSAAPPNTHCHERFEDSPPHEMSYRTIKRVQYGGSRAQSRAECVHIFLSPMWMIRVKTPGAAGVILS